MAADRAADGGGGLLLACLVGVLRLWTGAYAPVWGPPVNIVWVAYDLVILSVIFRAAAFRAPEPTEELVA